MEGRELTATPNHENQSKKLPSQQNHTVTPGKKLITYECQLRLITPTTRPAGREAAEFVVPSDPSGFATLGASSALPGTR